MLTFEIKHQDSYSRGELLLRSFFGWLYILIPHALLLMFFAIWVYIAAFLAWWIILFTGKTPDFYYNAMIGLYRWSTRISSRFLNLSDGYPSFGPSGTDDKTTVDFPLEHVGRGQLLLRSFFGWLYAGIPHMFCIYFRMIGTYVLVILAWFAVLFTGKYPAGWHKFNVGTLRWQTRLALYLLWLYPNYPPFSGAPDQMEEADKPIDQL